MARFRLNNGYKQYSTGNSWQYTHRTVAAKASGGTIPQGYEVHHKNCVKTDNRPSNLAIVSKETHHQIHNKNK